MAAPSLEDIKGRGIDKIAPLPYIVKIKWKRIEKGTVNMSKLVITHVKPFPGSNRTAWNIDYNGQPVGQIWTYKEPGCKFPFSVKFLASDCHFFNTKKEAFYYVEEYFSTKAKTV